MTTSPSDIMLCHTETKSAGTATPHVYLVSAMRIIVKSVFILNIWTNSFVKQISGVSSLR